MAEKRKSLKRNGELCNPLPKADAHERTTIYIGLGGTGADVVSHIKMRCANGFGRTRRGPGRRYIRT